MLFGIGLSVSFIIFLDHKFEKKAAIAFKAIIEDVEKVEISIEKSHPSPPKVRVAISEDLIPTDTLSIDFIDSIPDVEQSTSFDDEFTLDDFSEEQVVIEKIIKTRTVPVQVKGADLQDETTIPESSIFSFEVQQWESPIKNRITYQRIYNILKIKGMDISKINIYLINGKYYLTDGIKFYLLTPCEQWERLVEINATQL